MELSFVYPIYNEIENLPRLLPETQCIAAGLVSDYEVVLVDDGSTDGSAAFIDRLAAEHFNIRAIHHRRNRGLGAAISTGFAQAAKELVLYMDSDFPVSVEEARDAIRRFSPDCDLLIGYRLGRAEGPRREIMSWAYNRLIRWTFGLQVHDVNFAFKLIRRSFLQQTRLRSEGSFVDAELLLEAARLGARIQEVGIHYHPRIAGLSTAASNRVVIRILGEMWRYRQRRGGKALGRAEVIINADDFGLCEAVNQGVVKAFEHGVVTSASILPTGEAFEDAASRARSLPELDVGVHLSLTQTRPVSPVSTVPSLVGDEGRFPLMWSSFLARYLRGAVSKREMEVEIRAQIEKTLEAGLRVSHLDSHQHLHMLPGILPLVAQLAAEYDIRGIRCPRQRRGQVMAQGLARLGRQIGGKALSMACRLGSSKLKSEGLLFPDDFRGFNEAGSWNRDSLAQTIADLDGGLTEIGCHPGVDDAIGDRFPWGYRWEQELSALTCPEVGAAVADSQVVLTTYRDSLAHRLAPK